MLSTPKELNPYRLAFEKMQELKDIENWTLGRYIQESIASAFSNKHKYPDKPYGMKDSAINVATGKPITDAERFQMFAMKFNKKFDKK